jgi:hypothetical protein
MCQGEETGNMGFMHQLKAISQLIITSYRTVDVDCEGTDPDRTTADPVAHRSQRNHIDRDPYAATAQTPFRVYAVNEKGLIEKTSDFENFLRRSCAG